jgi:hypothetical protein
MISGPGTVYPSVACAGLLQREILQKLSREVSRGCAFYIDRNAYLDGLALKFLAVGLRAGNKCSCFLPTEPCSADALIDDPYYIPRHQFLSEP